MKTSKNPFRDQRWNRHDVEYVSTVHPAALMRSLPR